MKRFMSVALVLVLVMAMLVGCGGGANDSPEAVVKKMFDATMNADMDGLIACLTPDMQDMLNGMLSLAKASGQEIDTAAILGDSLGDIKNAEFKFNGTTIDGDKATVSTTTIVTAADGTVSEDTADVPCVKVDGKWYVDMTNMMG